jgi:hypothetical protein
MTAPVRVAVPRKGRPLEAVLDRFAARADATGVADDVVSTLRFEKAVAKGEQSTDRGVYDRLQAYSAPEDDHRPDFTLLRDARDGKPRRIVFDSLSLAVDGTPVELIGREEPFRALRTHEFALGFDSADLVLEEVVQLEPEPLTEIGGLNDRIDPQDTDVRVVSGLGDTVYHTLLVTPEASQSVPIDALDREFVAAYEGDLCISPRYERLVEAVLGTDATDGVNFVYPTGGREEEAAIADVGAGVYLTVTGSTAHEYGLELGEQLFPSETVLMENACETDEGVEAVKRALATDTAETAIPPQ